MQANSEIFENKSQSLLTWLGLDIGTKRTGVAAADPTHTLASPICVLPTYPLDSLSERLVASISPRVPARLVVGLALETSGKEGTAAELCRQVGNLLAERLGVELAFVDERYSTRDAYARRQEAGFKAKRISKDIDAYAAASILQMYLEQQP